MKKILSIIFLSALLILFALPIQSKTIYVSSSEGTAQNNGLSAATPVNTIATAFNMGDSILLKAGDVFYETFTCENKYIDKYGEGSNPMLCGFKRIKQAKWEQTEPNIWKLKLNTDNFTGFIAREQYVNNIGCIYEYDKDQIHGRRVQFMQQLKENWDFYQTFSFKEDTPDSYFDDIYLYLDSDPNTLQLEFSVGLTAASLTNSIVENIRISGFGQGLVCNSNVTISNCRIDAIGGRSHLGSLSFSCHGSGVVLDANGDIANSQVRDCHITRCYEAGVAILAFYKKKVEATNVEISHNLIANCGRGFEVMMKNVVDANFVNSTFSSNTVLDSGNSGFDYPDFAFSTCHVLMDYGLTDKNISIDRNAFVKGNLCLCTMSLRNNLMSEWHNNVCFISSDDVIISNAANIQRDDIISITKIGKLKNAIKLLRETAGDISTHFNLCDNEKLQMEIARRAKAF